MTITTSNGTTVAIKVLTERAESAEAEVVTLRALLDGDEKPPMDRTAAEYLAWAVPHWRKRARAAEARLAAVEALVNNGQTVGWIERDGDVAWIAADAIRAALATTGEGEHVAREVFTADGIAFVRCSCTNAKSPTSFRWLTEHVPNGGLAELQAVVKRQGEGAKA